MRRQMWQHSASIKLFFLQKAQSASPDTPFGFRKVEAAQSVQPTLAAEGAAFLSAAFVKEAEGRAAGLTGDAFRAWRQGQIAPIYERFQRWMSAVLPTLLPDDKLASAIGYYQNHWTPLTRFLDHPAIPMDNSGAEREFQTVAKARLVAPHPHPGVLAVPRARSARLEVAGTRGQRARDGVGAQRPGPA